MTAKVRVCFAIKLSALIPYYERDFRIIEKIEVYIYIYIYIYIYLITRRRRRIRSISFFFLKKHEEHKKTLNSKKKE